jgi:hypothetical protein
MIMCAAIVPVLGALVGAAATIHAANAASDDAARAREQQERQMEQARKAATQAPAASETSADVTAAVQANRKRAAAAYGMGKTVTGVGESYSNGLGVGQKKQLGM